MRYKCITLLLGFFFTTSAWAQRTESLLKGPYKITNTYIPYKAVPKQSDPIRASLYSMAIPGLGQAYNGHYWKIPIIYAGGAVFGYFIRYNDIFYQKYLNALAEQEKTGTNSLNENFTTEFLDQRVNQFRRSRDYMVIFLSIFYAANIIDAYVYAHLNQFDISDDLSINIRPKLLQSNLGQPYMGLGIKLNFK